MYKHRLDTLIKKHGRTRNWISDKLKMPRVTFWRHVNKDTFTDEQKKQIEKLIITGICG